jgi:hypothetical protein
MFWAAIVPELYPNETELDQVTPLVETWKFDDPDIVMVTNPKAGARLDPAMVVYNGGTELVPTATVPKASEVGVAVIVGVGLAIIAV